MGGGGGAHKTPLFQDGEFHTGSYYYAFKTLEVDKKRGLR